VYLDISLKNTSTERINNVAYVDKVPAYFAFVNNDLKLISEEDRIIQRRPGIGEYNILIDGFYLDPGEETIIRIELETLPLSYGHIQVGLYEDGEV